jgi:hypothetical protein
MDPAPTTDLERQIDRLIFVRVRREWLLDFFDEGKARNAVRNNLDFNEVFCKKTHKVGEPEFAGAMVPSADRDAFSHVSLLVLSS